MVEAGCQPTTAASEFEENLICGSRLLRDEAKNTRLHNVRESTPRSEGAMQHAPEKSWQIDRSVAAAPGPTTHGLRGPGAGLQPAQGKPSLVCFWDTP